MKKIIFTADDFGVVDAIDEGIIDAIESGLVKSVAVFANGKYSIQKAKALIAKYPDVELGVHLTISSGKPILAYEKVPTLCDSKKNFWSFKNFSNKIDESELEAELDAQIMVFKNNNIPIYHLSSHYSLLILFPKYFKIFLNVARKHNLKIRSPKVKPVFRQNTFLLYMRAVMIEDINPVVSREIEIFGTIINKYFKNNANGVKTLDYLDTDHYGPIPMSKITSKRELARKKKKKVDNLFDRLEKLKKSRYKIAEFVLHLHKDELKSHSQYKKEIPTDYPGIDYKYFDSRVVELHSIKSLTLGDLNINKITLGSWK